MLVESLSQFLLGGMMHRRALVIALGIVALGLGMYRPLLASLEAPVTLDVVSTDPMHQVEFALRGFGAGVEPIQNAEPLRTPYHLEMRGEEIYALVRRTSASGALRVALRNAVGASGESRSDITMLVATRNGVGVTGFEH